MGGRAPKPRAAAGLRLGGAVCRLVVAVGAGVFCLISAETAVAANGPVAAWARNDFGQLGDNSTTPSTVPVQVLGAGGAGGLSAVVSVATGELHSVAAKSDGTVWAWGDNASGQLGDNSTTTRLAPVQVVGPAGVGILSGITRVAAGVDHSLALGPNGTVWAWGANAQGQLGDNSTGPSLTPVQVVGPGGTGTLTGIIAIAAGNQFSLALRSDGSVWTWGYNVDGELGDNSTVNSPVPVQVVAAGGQGTLSGIVAVAVADAVGLAVRADGTVWAWGYGLDGELGNGSNVISLVPVEVGPAGAPLTGVVAVAGGTGAFGRSHSLALKSDGSVWAWGYNVAGELGNNSNSNSSLPVPVLGPGGSGTLGSVTAIAAGDEYSVALRSDGIVWAWGYNGAGELGDNSTANTSTPVQVLNLPHALALQAGCCGDHVLAIGAVAAQPTVTGVNPSSGPAGTAVTIAGTHLSGATAVTFGANAASFTVRSDSEIAATAPAGSGTVDVTVTTSTGTSQTSPADQYSYTPAAAGPVATAPAVIPAAPSPPTGTAVALSGAVNPEGDPTSAYFQYGLDPSYRSSGGPVVYDQSTPTQTVGSDFTNHALTAVVSGLVPNALYHFRLVASSGAGSTFGPDQTFVTALAPPPPPPVLGKTENFTPIGTVFVLEQGKFVKLTQTLQLPTGTVVDTLRGSLSLVAAGGGGGPASDTSSHNVKKSTKSFGTFGGAVFKVTQAASGPQKGLTTLSLIEGAYPGAPTYASCKANRTGDATPAALSSRTLQLLRAHANGRFRTSGRYAAATVRGTRWTTSDRCDGTLIAVQMHTVLVTDFVKRVTIILRAGQTYLARAGRSRRG